MKVDKSKSVYRESPTAKVEFDKLELRHLRFLLRRLRFLETRVNQSGGLGSSDPSGGPAFSEMEVDALAWVLNEVGFLALPGDFA